MAVEDYSSEEYQPSGLVKVFQLPGTAGVAQGFKAPSWADHCLLRVYTDNPTPPSTPTGDDAWYSHDVSKDGSNIGDSLYIAANDAIELVKNQKPGCMEFAVASATADGFVQMFFTAEDR